MKKTIITSIIFAALFLTLMSCGKKNPYDPANGVESISYSADLTETEPITETDTGGDWILIKTPGELIYLDNNQVIIGTKNIRIVNNLDLCGTQIQGITAFAKIFDGNNKIIANFKIDRNSSTEVALINRLNTGGVVSNITLKDCQITGYDYVGSVIGRNYGTAANCQNIATSVTGNKGVGGIVGRNETGTIRNCYNTGTVFGHENVGGVSGKNYIGAAVENCYNTGSITSTKTAGSTDVGGIVGDNEGDIKNCYNAGNIQGDDAAGGVLGNNFNGTIESCYNTGTVSSSYSGSSIGSIGGVAGNNNVTVKNCYNTGSVSFTGTAADVSSGGVVGDNYGAVENCYNIGSVSGLNYVGGVIGYVDSSGTQSICYFLKVAGGINASLNGLGDGGSGSPSDVDATPIASSVFSTISWGGALPWTIKSGLGGNVSTRPVLIGVGPEGR